MAFTLDPPKAAGEIGRLLISHDLVFENLLQNLPKDRPRPLLPRVVVDMKKRPQIPDLLFVNHAIGGDLSQEMDQFLIDQVIRHRLALARESRTNQQQCKSAS